MPKRRAIREQAIIAAAWRLFVSDGFGRTSMDAIAQAADISKATLYSYFASKDELFARVVAEEGARHSTALTQPDAEAGGQRAIGDVLRKAASEFSRLMLSADNMGVTRMIIADAASQPGLGRRFFAAGPDVLIGLLAQRMAEAMDRGELRPADPRLTAGQFIGMILGDLHLRMMICADAPKAGRRGATAQAGVEAFLRAYAPDVATQQIAPRKRARRRSPSTAP